VDSNKKVLIVTYYWPPSGGSGVQRWLKFVKYLAALGWEPYVFTPQNPSFPILDPSLEKDVPEEAEIIRFPIWEPYNSFNKISRLFGSKSTDNPVDFISTKEQSGFKKITTWMRGNMIVPDPRVFWVKPSVKFLHGFLKDNRITSIITTGPPHSIHLIGYELKKKNPGLTWLADFRDPWSQWGLLDSLKVSDTVRNIHRNLESKVLRTADIVSTITPFYVRQFEQLSNRKVEFIPNGYDDEDFKQLKIQRPMKFTIRHVGIINERCDPRSFIQALSDLLMDRQFTEDTRLEFIGEVNSDFKNFLAENQRVADITTFIPTVPHSDLIKFYGSASLFLLVLVGYKDAEGYMPGKLFEYLATGLPVLGVGPENGDAAALLQETGGGVMISPESQERIKTFISTAYANWKSGTGMGGITISNHNKYSRKNITVGLTKLLSSR
jgi:glycosyltransferase involved in cell wall biosynthesis